MGRQCLQSRFRFHVEEEPEWQWLGHRGKLVEMGNKATITEHGEEGASVRDGPDGGGRKEQVARSISKKVPADSLTGDAAQHLKLKFLTL